MVATVRSRLIVFRSSGGRSCASEIAGASLSTFTPHPTSPHRIHLYNLCRIIWLTDDYIDIATRETRVHQDAADLLHISFRSQASIHIVWPFKPSTAASASKHIFITTCLNDSQGEKILYEHELTRGEQRQRYTQQCREREAAMRR